MIFAEMKDSHDKRVDKMLAKSGDIPDDELHEAPLVTNYNLVGIRRRLNNVEVGVWLIVLITALDMWRHW
ncbi:MAG: hypothetical protein E5Y32_25330 [Mesorhizobium sp.]|uniref:hypothetical protein n=1 Tax=Mesorhizobium sp. TaxID=1871066 RepID=UPI00120B67BC|nr:hypothetical protein [Mesorhizobium sp.]TIM39183.1 MAG: hypothetical protein E5Y56_27265 [Mesorhizobium sp.]TIN38629.1 MAG: hypothetical protein E5Y32_25330 [Mesorhizobium sp.]